MDFMSPSFIRNSRGNIGVVLVKYKSIKLPAVFNKDAEIVSEVRLVVKIGNQLQIFYESTADILKLSDLTETERLSVNENYDLDEKFYPARSEIDKGMKCALDQIDHCISKCIAGLVRFDSDLKWPEKEGRERINKFIRKTEVGKLVLEVNGEITSRK
jgi:hypothetical protein